MNILKVIGGLVVLKFLAGEAASNFINRLPYKILPIQRKDFSFKFREGEPIVYVNLAIQIKNGTAVNLTAQNLNVVMSQDWQALSNIYTSNLINLPSGATKTLKVTATIKGIDVVSRIEQILNGSSLLSPIKINGELVFTNGWVLPISRKIELLKVG